MRTSSLSILLLALAAGCSSDSEASGRGTTGGSSEADTASSDDGGTQEDTAQADTEVADTTVADTEVADTAVADTEVADTTVEDTGTADTEIADTTPVDTTPADTGSVDTTVEDTAVADTGSDAPGPLPDMGSAPLGFLGSPPIGSSGGACGTGSWWWGFNLGSDNMKPGGNCIECHAGNGGPDYTFAGTVMAGYNDADDCRGVPNVQVEILDVNGNVALTMTANAAGNFSSNSTAVELPYSARVRIGDRVREMTTQTFNGDCNSCHTTAGSDLAPGRVVLP